MAEQDDASPLGNMQLAMQAALMQARTITVGKVLAYREIGPHSAPVVDVEVAPLLLGRPVDGGAAEATKHQVKRNIPVAFWQCGEFLVMSQIRKGQHILLFVCDRDLNTWMQGDGEQYRVGIPGVTHNINDAIAFPILTPEAFQPGVRPKATELFIGDRTGTRCSIEMESVSGTITIKAAGPVNVESPAVTLGDTGTPLPIARVGADFVTVTAGGGSFPILSGPIPGGSPSAHKVKG